MKQDTPDGKKSAFENGLVEQLKPKVARLVNKHYMHKAVLDVRGRRFEVTLRVEVREIGRGPAIVVRMPQRD